MVKAGKWLRSFLTGKKERSHEKVAERRNWPQLPPPPPPPPTPPPSPPPSTPKEKRRRSFSLERKRRAPFAPPSFISGPESARSAAARGTSFSAIENVAAIKIQASFRSFLARKALRALKGLVKLQAVVRGFLVRKQAAATLRSMQALLTVQVRARAMRVLMIQEAQAMTWRDRNQTRMAVESRLQPLNDKERSLGSSKSRKSGPISQADTKQHRATNYYQKSSSSLSPSPDPMAGTFNELSFATAESSSSASTKQPHRIISSEADALQDGPCSLFPNYMANTESWKAKARSQSAPRQRNDLSDYARQYSGKQRTSIDGKNPNRAVREQIAWPIMLDRSVTIAGCNRIIAA